MFIVRAFLKFYSFSNLEFSKHIFFLSFKIEAPQPHLYYYKTEVFSWNWNILNELINCFIKITRMWNSFLIMHKIFFFYFIFHRSLYTFSSYHICEMRVLCSGSGWVNKWIYERLRRVLLNWEVVLYILYVFLPFNQLLIHSMKRNFPTLNSYKSKKKLTQPIGNHRGKWMNDEGEQKKT